VKSSIDINSIDANLSENHSHSLLQKMLNSPVKARWSQERNTNLKYTPVFLLVAGIATSFAQTTDYGTEERNREIPEITIFGNQDDITAIPGSATEISLDDINHFAEFTGDTF
ncbi:uncharacterized protein METZ01_LOCUS290629, partial [marine metagenome]